MAYPQDGATYKHTPKFIDRMKADEGKTITPYVQHDLDRDYRMAGDVVKFPMSDNTRRILRETAPTEPLPSVPTADIVPFPKGVK